MLFDSTEKGRVTLVIFRFSFQFLLNSISMSVILCLSSSDIVYTNTSTTSGNKKIGEVGGGNRQSIQIWMQTMYIFLLSSNSGVGTQERWQWQRHFECNSHSHVKTRPSHLPPLQTDFLYRINLLDASAFYHIIYMLRRKLYVDFSTSISFNFMIDFWQTVLLVVVAVDYEWAKSIWNLVYLKVVLWLLFDSIGVEVVLMQNEQYG